MKLVVEKKLNNCFLAMTQFSQYFVGRVRLALSVVQPISVERTLNSQPSQLSTLFTLRNYSAVFSTIAFAFEDFINYFYGVITEVENVSRFRIRVHFLRRENLNNVFLSTIRFSFNAPRVFD